VRGTWVGSLLALAAAAGLAGAWSFAAIGRWIADFPQQVLAVLGARFDAGPAQGLAPEESTVRRLTQHVDGDLVDAATSDWLIRHSANQSEVAGQTALRAVTVDGKPLRGTFGRAGGAGVHYIERNPTPDHSPRSEPHPPAQTTLPPPCRDGWG
jgi:hypothetical protein